MGAIFGQIIGVLIEAIDVAIRKGKDIKEALAASLEEAAAKIRSGELNIDDAVEQAKKDQSKLDNIRDKFK